MRLEIFSIVLDGMPFLPIQWDTFCRLRVDFHWTIAHGAAANVHDTAWCKPQEARLSRDGSSGFLETHRGDPRITIIEREWWEGGKTQMCNACLEEIPEPCVLLQVDVDELYLPNQIEKIVEMFAREPIANCARFWCRYWVGKDLLIVSRDHWGNRNELEWLRAWRFKPGMRFKSHEPPMLSGVSCCGSRERGFSRNGTRTHGIIFDHAAYVFESQIRYKESFYNYPGAVDAWKRLQAHTVFPARLRDFFFWVEPDVTVDKISDISSPAVSLSDKLRFENVAFFFGDSKIGWPSVLANTDLLHKP